MKKRIRRTAVFLLCLLLTIGTALPAAAADLLEVTPSGSPFVNVDALLPGQSVQSKYVYITNGSKSWNYSFYLETVPAGLEDFGGDTAKKAISDALLRKLELKVEANLYGYWQVIYQGNVMGNSTSRGSSMYQETLKLGLLHAGEGMVLRATVTVPGYINNNDVGSSAKFYWKFYSEKGGKTVYPQGGDKDSSGIDYTAGDRDVSSFFHDPTFGGGGFADVVVSIIDPDTADPNDLGDLLGRLPTTGGGGFSPLNELEGLVILLLLLMAGLIILCKIEAQKKRPRKAL